MAIAVLGYTGNSSGGGGSTPIGATLMKTGQTTSYRTGDDGDIEAGRATDFFTLNYTNPFGNTNRFTDELGGATYANDIVIDWSAYDNIAGTVLGYTKNVQPSAVWNDAIDNALALSIGAYTSGWRLPNWKEMANIFAVGYSRALDYAPFSNAFNHRFWTSTTLDGYTNIPLVFLNQWQIFGSGITSSWNWYGVRTFTVTGTTLT
jgi:hypothetical protein